MKTYEIVGIEPEPWTAPEVAIGRKNNKVFPMVYQSANMKAYQEAIREEMALQCPHAQMEKGEISLQFFFWRGTDSIRKNVDATNLQKSLEDALQGILYLNDAHNRRVTSEIVEQGPGVNPAIIITVEPYIPSVVSKPEPQEYTRPPSQWAAGQDSLF
jgi:Holliday junction resolvase RusA-like endonuclease